MASGILAPSPEYSQQPQRLGSLVWTGSQSRAPHLLGTPSHPVTVHLQSRADTPAISMVHLWLILSCCAPTLISMGEEPGAIQGIHRAVASTALTEQSPAVTQARPSRSHYALGLQRCLGGISRAGLPREPLPHAIVFAGTICESHRGAQARPCSPELAVLGNTRGDMWLKEY